MTRSRHIAADAVTRAGFFFDEPLRAEYVLCDHGYLRRGWCDECQADSPDRPGPVDPWLTALRSRTHPPKARAEVA